MNCLLVSRSTSAACFSRTLVRRVIDSTSLSSTSSVVLSPDAPSMVGRSVTSVSRSVGRSRQSVGRPRRPRIRPPIDAFAVDAVAGSRSCDRTNDRTIERSIVDVIRHLTSRRRARSNVVCVFIHNACRVVSHPMQSCIHVIA